MAGKLCQFLIVAIDAFIEVMPFLQQIRQDLTGEERQPILGIRQDFR